MTVRVCLTILDGVLKLPSIMEAGLQAPPETAATLRRQVLQIKPEGQKTLSIYQKDDKIFVTVIGANDALVDVKMGGVWYQGLRQGEIGKKGNLEQVDDILIIGVRI